MFRYLITLITLCASLAVYAEETQGSLCLQQAKTQRQMNRCAGIGLQEADNELNRVYNKIRQVYKNDPMFLQNLKLAQRAWIKSRDADFEMRYPHAKEAGYYGSVYPMCAAGNKAGLTLSRIAFLKQWLVGIEEGDVCTGSLKFDHELKAH